MDIPYKAVSLVITKPQHAVIIKIKDLGYFPSKSAIIRRCLNIGLPKILKHAIELNSYIQNNDLISVFDYLKENGFTIHKGLQPRKTKPIVSTYINGKNMVIQ